MTGSINDRMALHILRQAYAGGRLGPGDAIVEATSGNTGISFAARGRALGHPLIIFVPDWMSPERIGLIRGLGARIVLVSREQGGFLGSIRMAEQYTAGLGRAFLPRRSSNPLNTAAHESATGPEIWWQLGSQDLIPDAFVAGIGTGDAVMGMGRYLRARNPGVKIHPLEPAESPALSAGHKAGAHRIQGISDEFIPPIVDLNHLDDIVDAADGDAIPMARKLASRLGLGVGISSDANFIGATDLHREEPVRGGYLAPEVELLECDRRQAVSGRS